MTRNLYLGADLQPLFNTTADALAATAKATYQQVLDSEIDARLDAVSHEIMAAKPDLVALQEASVWTEQPAGGSSPIVRYDYLATLLARLADLGATYTAAATANGFSGGLPVEGVGLASLQDRDVILVRGGSSVTVANPKTGRFTAKLTVSVVGAPIEVVRGWASIEATVAGRTFLLVATHLEAFDDSVRDLQQTELLAMLNGSTMPALVLGDLNSAATGTGNKAYAAMVSAGYGDAWATAHAGDPGLTCCRSADLTGGTLTDRIDFVLFRGAFQVLAADVVGADASARTPGGRWPSDHAGVVATLTAPG
jgi:endonuclease/exonuclease/phosphatase family metal-dependent hydrolase